METFSPSISAGVLVSPWGVTGPAVYQVRTTEFDCCLRAAPDLGGTVSREDKETMEYVLNFELFIRELKPPLYFKLNERFLLCYS